MKNKKYLFILVLFLFIGLILSGILMYGGSLKKLTGDVSSISGYKSYSELTSQPIDYSYSTIFLTNKTKIYANVSNGTVQYETTAFDGDVATPVLRFDNSYTSGGVGNIIITNCALNSSGELINVEFHVEANIWATTDAGATPYVVLHFLPIQVPDGGQSNPSTNLITTKISNMLPIKLELFARYGSANVTLTYYKNMTLKNIEEGKYTTKCSNSSYCPSESLDGMSIDKAVVDTSNSEIDRSITHINSFYDDIDQTTQPTTPSPSSLPFGGKEGFKPTTGDSVIYFAKTQVTIPNNGTMELRGNDGVYIYSRQLAHGFDGSWYGNSAAVYTELASGDEGIYKFTYSGTAAGMGFMFYSPIIYQTTAPVKKVSRDVVYTGEEFRYGVYQYIPNNYITSTIDFSSIYSNLGGNYTFNGYKLTDDIDSRLTINGDSITIHDASNDPGLASYFSSSVTNNKVNVDLKNSNIGSSSTIYNNNIVVNIPVKAETVTTTPYTVNNTGSVLTHFGGSVPAQTKSTNQVSTIIKSPSVIYDCETNGGTGNETVYHNVEDDIDLTKTCTNTSHTFLGWAATPTINNPSQLLSSKKIPTADEMHADNTLEVTRLYAIYTKNIEISAKNETKVYDDTALIASDNTTYGGGKCYVSNNSLQTGHYIDLCTYNGSITNVGETTKEILSVKIVDNNNEEVTSLYEPNFINAKLTITKREIIVKAIDQQKYYDGTALVATESSPYQCVLSDNSPNNLANGHTISCTSTGSRTDIGGTGEKEKHITGVTVNKNSIVVTNNYEISTIDADLIINDSLCPNTSNYSGTYDGNSHTITVGTVDGTIRYRTSTTGTWSTTLPTRLDKGTTTVYIQVEKDSQVTNCPNRTITILPRKIKVKAKTQSKVYDGLALVATENSPYTCELASDSLDTLVLGHTMLCSSTGDRTNVGGTNEKEKHITNVIVNNGSIVVTNNYEIDTEDADLIVTKADSTCPSVTNYNGTYDGNNHTITSIGGTGGVVYYKLDDSTTWSTNLPQVTNAGTNIVNVKVVGDSNHNNKMCPDSSITINKREITIKAKNQSKVYDGTALVATEDSPYKCTLEDGELVNNDTFICVSSGNITNVGIEDKNIDSVLIKNGNLVDVTDNYIINTINGKLEITKADSTCPTVTNYNDVYDGNNHTITSLGGTGGVVYYKFSEDTIWGTTLPELKNTGTKTINIKIVGDSNHNDKICPNGLININKRQITYKADSDSKPYDGTPLTKQSASLISGSLVGGHVPTFSITGSIINVGKVDNILNSVSITDGLIDVTNNYEINRENGELEITSTSSVCPSITSYEGVYDGNSHTISVGNVTSGLIQYRISDDDNWSSVIPTRVNQGVTTVQVRVKGDENHDDEICPSGTIKINKKALTISAVNQEKEYDGEALVASETSPYNCIKTNGQLVSGHSFVCTSTGSITNVGEVDKTLERVTIKDNNLVDVTDNYDITMVSAKLKITPIDAICPSITNYNGVYDGNNHTIEVGSVTTGEVLFKTSEQDVWSNVLPKRIDSGETIVNIKVVGDSNHNDVICQNGKITINKKSIVVKTTNEEKVYDRIPLVATNNTCSLKDGSILANNQNLTGCAVSGSQTNVGSSPKTIDSIVIKDSDDNPVNLNNYDITYENGTLTVTKLKFIITLEDNGADSEKEGTKKIIQICDDAIYVDEEETRKMKNNENPIEIPEKDGYIFGGYYSSNDEDAIEIIDINGYLTENLDETMCLGNRTIYARWIPRTYTLTVIYNNGKDNSVYTLRYKEEKNIEDPEKDGYTFTKWTLTGETSKFENRVFTMGKEDAIIEANYVKTPDKCDLFIKSDKYKIDEPKQIILVAIGETLDEIKKNIKTTSVIRTITEDEIVIVCNDEEKTYKLSRFILPKTGTVQLKYFIIFTSLLLSTISLILIRKIREKAGK